MRKHKNIDYTENEKRNKTTLTEEIKRMNKDCECVISYNTFTLYNTK